MSEAGKFRDDLRSEVKDWEKKFLLMQKERQKMLSESKIYKSENISKYESTTIIRFTTKAMHLMNEKRQQTVLILDHHANVFLIFCCCLKYKVYLHTKKP